MKTKESMSAKVIAFALKGINIKKNFTEGSYEKFISSKITEKKYQLPKLKYKCKTSKITINEKDVYTFTLQDSYDKNIIYLHGGAYVAEPNIYHVKLIDKIAYNTNSKVYMPIYPLSPNHTVEETYLLLEKLYNTLLNENKEIIIVGDSAGGGLALAFTEYLISKEKNKPSKLVLMSPWLDITMCNEKIINYAKQDPILDVYGLKKIGELWAKNLEKKEIL